MAAASASMLCIVIVICSLLSTPSTANHEVDALIDVKKMILEDPSNALQTWNPSSPNPCKWKYVFCDAHGHVYTVHLALKNLPGALSPRIGDLQNLYQLSLEFNKLSGRVPRGKLSEFGYKSFQGNPDFCGDVLKKECITNYP
ncbi:leucine-rich repeat protein 1-like [Cryptomeria japonica]|uniref:leucine-rich repeat protein 1-like n=1 Tax=Cryptomeria japonica TaxID=3369 RepID=UPI0027DA8160|nr:leucine-rich repeat protein 1-like [Cryptomeria japonica]